MPDELKIGFTSPNLRYWPLRSKIKRESIGFVHFGPPEEEPEPPRVVHPDVKQKREDRADEQRWIEAMADDEPQEP
jgi:hypothetical protein